MAGEESKKSGELGEKIAEGLLNLIGWNTLEKGFDVQCKKNDEHSRMEGKKRTTHGIDFYFNYKCPLSDRLQENVIISVKNREEYPDSEKTKKTMTKTFLKELSQSVECFVKSDKYRQSKFDGIQQIENVGVLFWFNSDENKEDGIIEEVADMQLTCSDIKYTMYIVDNKAANFLFQSIRFAKKYFDEKEPIKFAYQNTGYNNSNYDKKSCGEILPVQDINSHIMKFKVESKKILIITTREKFDKEELNRLIGLTQDLTTTWGTKVIIAFPDYDYRKHENDVNRAKSRFEDNEFTKTIDVVSYKEDFRNL